ncbi:unnamed protein product [Vitrella brassicaformis CCMP3155]|uniref:Uncharacterized protein n=2 Tax=Vitrella brassicaformis TaxID=1169539 RepID=A0A0G4FUS6_VITBC|nr:unnamed protein product [Vitrella brassicaformis CCMP3155]|eukprot:CEM18637.1 unnamed protein product [Vitrella brassicaformis CCMP3155]
MGGETSPPGTYTPPPADFTSGGPGPAASLAPSHMGDVGGPSASVEPPDMTDHDTPAAAPAPGPTGDEPHVAPAAAAAAGGAFHTSFDMGMGVASHSTGDGGHSTGHVGGHGVHGMGGGGNTRDGEGGTGSGDARRLLRINLSSSVGSSGAPEWSGGASPPPLTSGTGGGDHSGRQPSSLSGHTSALQLTPVDSINNGTPEPPPAAAAAAAAAPAPAPAAAASAPSWALLSGSAGGLGGEEGYDDDHPAVHHTDTGTDAAPSGPMLRLATGTGDTSSPVSRQPVSGAEGEEGGTLTAPSGQQGINMHMGGAGGSSGTWEVVPPVSSAPQQEQEEQQPPSSSSAFPAFDDEQLPQPSEPSGASGAAPASLGPLPDFRADPEAEFVWEDEYDEDIQDGGNELNLMQQEAEGEEVPPRPTQPMAVASGAGEPPDDDGEPNRDENGDMPHNGPEGLPSPAPLPPQEESADSDFDFGDFSGAKPQEPEESGAAASGSAREGGGWAAGFDEGDDEWGFQSGEGGAGGEGATGDWAVTSEATLMEDRQMRRDESDRIQKALDTIQKTVSEGIDGLYTTMCEHFGGCDLRNVTLDDDAAHEPATLQQAVSIPQAVSDFIRTGVLPADAAGLLVPLPVPIQGADAQQSVADVPIHMDKFDWSSSRVRQRYYEGLCSCLQTPPDVPISAAFAQEATQEKPVLRPSDSVLSGSSTIPIGLPQTATQQPSPDQAGQVYLYQPPIHLDFHPPDGQPPPRLTGRVGAGVAARRGTPLPQPALGDEATAGMPHACRVMGDERRSRAHGGEDLDQLFKRPGVGSRDHRVPSTGTGSVSVTGPVAAASSAAAAVVPDVSGVTDDVLEHALSQLGLQGSARSSQSEAAGERPSDTLPVVQAQSAASGEGAGAGGQPSPAPSPLSWPFLQPSFGLRASGGSSVTPSPRVQRFVDALPDLSHLLSSSVVIPARKSDDSQQDGGGGGGLQQPPPTITM